MRLRLFGLILLLSIILAGCSMLYGSLVYEDKKDILNEVSFEFYLNESSFEHMVSLTYHYKGTGGRERCYMDLDVAIQGPDYSSLETISNNFYDDHQTRRQRDNRENPNHCSYIGSTGQEVFKFIPSSGGLYTINVSERNIDTVEIESITIKVYEKKGD